jgi:hypothetical protein
VLLLLLRRGVQGILLALLVSGVVIVAALSLWMGGLLIYRPQPPQWLVHQFPGWSKGWGNIPLQTLADVEAEVQSQQRRLGELMSLNDFSSQVTADRLYLLPIYAPQSPCSQDCEAIVELRLYGLHQRDRDSLQLQELDRLSITGPLESTVIDPLTESDLGTLGSTYALPLTDLKPLQDEALSGGWLTLSGRWQSQGSPVLYGQMLHIDPQTLRITSVLNWKSPVGRLPTWTNLDQSALPELVVNQSLGLEPSYQIYTVKHLDTVHLATRLQEVTLTPLTLPPERLWPAYRDALFLAQQGLWSDAAELLEAGKSQLTEGWTLDLEQQLQLVKIHAQYSQRQADRDWSQPSQKLLALLLDGQWKAALTAIKNPQSDLREAVMPLLKRDSTRLWQRVSATLKVTPQDREARLWGALLLFAKQDEKAALQWLTKDPQSPLKQEFQAVVISLIPPKPSALANLPATNAVASSNPSQPGNVTASPVGLFGHVQRVAQPTPTEWMPVLKTVPISEQVPGYVVTVYSPLVATVPVPTDTSPAAIAVYLEALGLAPPYTLQIISLAPGQGSQTLPVLGVQWQNNAVLLLTANPTPPLADPWIAISGGQWVSLGRIPAQPLSELFQSQPKMGDRLLPVLSQHLGVKPENLMNTLQNVATAGEPPTVFQWINATHHSGAEVLLTINPQIINPTKTTTNDFPMQVLMSAQGQLLYSNQGTGNLEQLLGWVEWPSGGVALVTRQQGQPGFKLWSTEAQQFR